MHPGFRARLPLPVNSASSGCVVATSFEPLKHLQKAFIGIAAAFQRAQNAPMAAYKCLSRWIRAKNSAAAIFSTSPINSINWQPGRVV